MTEDYLKCQMVVYTLGGARMNELRGRKRGNFPYFRKKFHPRLNHYSCHSLYK